MNKIILLLLININCVYANMEKSYEEGKEYANVLHGNAKGAVTKANLQDVPGFVTDNPQEASLYKHPNELADKSQQTLNTSDAGKNLRETAKTRQRFTIDPNTDPLFKKHSFDESLNIQDEAEGTQLDGVIEKTCEEGGDDVTYECLENRHVVPQVPLKRATLTVNHLAFTPTYVSESYVVRSGNFWRHTEWGTRNKHTGYTLSLPKEINKFKDQFCKGFIAKDSTTGEVFNIDCNRIQAFKINSGSITDSNNTLTIASSVASLNITLDHTTYEGEGIDEWTGCDSFEQMVDQGLCQYGGDRTLTKGPETRNINGYQITKDAWQYRQIYHCKMIKDECNALRAQGCVQTGSKCKEWRQGKCWIYEQKYQCPNGKLSLKKTNAPALGAFCLTGNCHDTSYQANGEMLDVISRLSMLKEIQKDIQAQNNSNDNFKIFKGTDYQCSRNCINFKDCCGGMKGWGIKIHLAGCKPEELQLAQMRQKNLCHQVGNTYCSKKVLGKCVNKKTSFCCFATKFAKILQVQGRSQLGLGWGDPKCPDCRALTVVEISKMDLSKMNFSELFEDIMQKYKSPNLSNLQELTSKQVTESMNRIADGLKTNTSVKKGVIGDKKDDL